MLKLFVFNKPPASLNLPGGCVCAVRNIMARPKAKLPPKPTKGTKQKRYEVPPHRIGVVKSHDSVHTGGLKGSYWAAERFHDDIMIRNLIEGSFYERITSDIVIKRKLNTIAVCFFVSGREVNLAKIYFLRGFCEKLLTKMMGCTVSIELRTGPEFV